MRYLYTQHQDKATFMGIVENIEVKDGALYATRVGVFAGWDEKGEEVFKACTPVAIVVSTPWNLEEYLGKL